jgi:flagellar protein FliS
MGAAAYSRTRIQTSSREQVLLMLLDGALRRIRAGIDALERHDIGAAGKSLASASDIVVELGATLERSRWPEMVDNLAKVYEFVALRLAQAANTRDALPAREAEKAFIPIVDAFHAAVAQIERGA